MRSMCRTTRVERCLEASSGLSVSTPTPREKSPVVHVRLYFIVYYEGYTIRRHTRHSLDTPFHAHFEEEGWNIRIKHPFKDLVSFL